MFLCPVTFKIPDRLTFAFFNLLNCFASAVVGELFVAALKKSICHNALYHILYFAFPHWLYFKPHMSSGLLFVLMER